MDPIKQFAEMMALKLMLAQTLALVANQQDDRELWVANMREATLRSLGSSLNVSASDTKVSPVQKVKEIAQATIINTFDEVGRAGIHQAVTQEVGFAELGSFGDLVVERDQQVFQFVQSGPRLAELGSCILGVGVGAAEEVELHPYGNPICPHSLDQRHRASPMSRISRSVLSQRPEIFSRPVLGAASPISRRS